MQFNKLRELHMFEDMVLTSPSKELIDDILSNTMKLQNPNLYELAAKYLNHLKFDDIDMYIGMLKQQHNYGDLQRDHIGDMDDSESRVKQGSDWDEYNSDYNIVASYSNRRNDVSNYPNHKAYNYLGKKQLVQVTLI